MAARGPKLPTLAVKQVGSYLRYSGRSADVVATAALDPIRSRSVKTRRGAARCRNLADRNVMEYRGHSSLTLAARITLAHFSVSSAMSLPKPAGENVSGVLPKSANCAFILGSARPALISRLRLSMTSAGVPFGTPAPYHALIS